MSVLIKLCVKQYKYIFNELSDKRLQNLPLLGSPFPILGLVFFYGYFAIVLGPKLMENRKPMNLSIVINSFNVIQIVSNLFILIYGFYNTYWQSDFSLMCQAQQRNNMSPTMTTAVYLTYFYYLIKLMDLLDTVFFVLRKKFSQITFLHVYHHGGMTFGVYVCTKFLSGSHTTLLGLVNSFVHTVMYSYYFLTSYKPELKKSLWWKKHITQLQMIQFATLVVHFFNSLMIFDCDFPKFISFMAFAQNIFMFILFTDFYYRTYVEKVKTLNVS